MRIYAASDLIINPGVSVGAAPMFADLVIDIFMGLVFRLFQQQIVSHRKGC